MTFTVGIRSAGLRFFFIIIILLHEAPLRVGGLEEKYFPIENSEIHKKYLWFLSFDN